MMMYPRGSEWRRWDLHVHTPGTQKNDEYTGENIEKKWDLFYQSVADYIGDGSDPTKRIVAVGITDYLSVDNYLRVVKEKRLPDSVELVLPNVELRIMPTSKKGPTNIHCIFNPEIADKLERRFINQIKVQYGRESYSASKQDLIDYGRHFSGNDGMEEQEALKVGIEQFVIPENALEEVFINDHELRENTVIIVPNSSQDGASGITQNKEYQAADGGKVSQLEAAKRVVYQLADMIFSGNPNDALFFAGNSIDSVEALTKKYGGPKPCVHGSDAHRNEDLFEPDGGRYCWIKADPTFNGLKQVVYEPSRACISAVIPEEKPGYQVIDSVFVGDDKVQKDAIVFNDNLTCIIGGKSTGKSLLLHNMALAIDPNQVREKEKTTLQRTEGRDLKDVIVTWKDGAKTGEKEAEGRKIVYVPQTYLNRLSDENEETTEIDEIIKSVVLISPDAKAADQKMQESIKAQKNIVEKLIYDAILSFDEINEKEEEKSEIGSLYGIDKEIKKLNKQKDLLTKKGTVTDKEIEEYNNSVTRLKRINELIEQLRADIDFIRFEETVVSRKLSNYILESEDAKQLDTIVDEIVETANRSWNEKKEVLIKTIEKRIERLNDEKNGFEERIRLLAPKIEENEAVRKLTETIQSETEKYKKVSTIEESINAKKVECKDRVESLAKGFMEYKAIHEEYENTINHRISINKDDLMFSVETPFRMDAFRNTVEGITDIRSLRACKSVMDIDAITSDWINEENIVNLIMLYLDNRLKVLKKQTTENALRQILSDWNNTTYMVSMDGDMIDGMSPGKKALVLLKLLINLAESRCPILIDQPEDDLDNRSVFDELIPFIKSKKSQRQIIVVTHNANVVLGGDAEEIIVANQQGKNTKNKSYRFEYRSGAIEENREAGDDSLLNSRGIQQHICDILEGGERAFEMRKKKYHLQEK